MVARGRRGKRTATHGKEARTGVPAAQGNEARMGVPAPASEKRLGPRTVAPGGFPYPFYVRAAPVKRPRAKRDARRVLAMVAAVQEPAGAPPFSTRAAGSTVGRRLCCIWPNVLLHLAK